MTDPKEKIPLFRTWTQWYVFVILFLLVQVLLYYFFTQAFA